MATQTAADLGDENDDLVELQRVEQLVQLAVLLLRRELVGVGVGVGIEI
jgi:hypothetical protein